MNHEFLNRFEVKVDAKGRLFVPSTYRKSIEEKEMDTSLYLERDMQKKCVKVYTKSFWDERIGKLKANLNTWDDNDMDIYRQYTSYVERVEMDSNGRILLQKQFLEAAEIEADAVLVGVIDTFEIWSKDNLENSFQKEVDFRKALNKKMGNKD